MSGNIIKIMPCKGFCDLFKEKPIPKDTETSFKLVLEFLFSAFSTACILND